MDTGAWIRAVRRTRGLSQRELATRAGVPLSTLARAEAGTNEPRLDTFLNIIGSVGYGFALLDDKNRPLALDPEHERIVDRAGRHFPAHLECGDEPDYIFGRYWWGWHHIAFWPSRDNVPRNVFWRRGRKYLPHIGYPHEHSRVVWSDAT